jgi:hypothetical protein
MTDRCPAYERPAYIRLCGGDATQLETWVELADSKTRNVPSQGVNGRGRIGVSPLDIQTVRRMIVMFSATPPSPDPTDKGTGGHR